MMHKSQLKAVVCAALILLVGIIACAPVQTGQSLASSRFVVDDSENEFFTLFRCQSINGLGYEPGIGRRDPSNIIRVGDTYYVWYTRIEGSLPAGVRKATSTQRAFPWDLAEIWYATSKNGFDWAEQGLAVTRGREGSFDDRSVFTPNILVALGNYYLVYQAVKAPYTQRTKNVVAMARSSTPDGPWEKFPEPILYTGSGGVWKGSFQDTKVLFRTPTVFLLFRTPTTFTKSSFQDTHCFHSASVFTVLFSGQPRLSPSKPTQEQQVLIALTMNVG